MFQVRKHFYYFGIRYIDQREHVSFCYSIVCGPQLLYHIVVDAVNAIELSVNFFFKFMDNCVIYETLAFAK